MWSCGLLIFYMYSGGINPFDKDAETMEQPDDISVHLKDLNTKLEANN